MVKVQCVHYIMISFLIKILALAAQIISREFNLSLSSGKHRSIQPFRYIRNLPTNYRKFENTHHLFMSIAGYFFLPFSFYVNHYVFYCNFILICFIDKLDMHTVFGIIVWDFAAVVVWCTMLHLGGIFREMSKESIRSWMVCRGKGGTEKKRKYLKKFAKSCRPLFVGTEGFIVMRKQSVLKFLRGMTRGTFRMLLTLK